MTRIVVRDSVDMRLLTMQKHKLDACENAIREGNGREQQNLSIQELANLFGFLKTDEDNNIISVEPDYDDQDDWDREGREAAAMAFADDEMGGMDNGMDDRMDDDMDDDMDGDINDNMDDDIGDDIGDDTDDDMNDDMAGGTDAAMEGEGEGDH